MGPFTQVIQSELKLPARENQGGFLIFLAQRLVWPALAFFIQLFGYAPFAPESLRPITGHLSVPLFTLASIWTLSFFMEYVGTGARLALRRDWGILELVYASPFPRLSWLLAITSAQALGAYLVHLPFLLLASLLSGIPLSSPGGIDLVSLFGATLFLALASIPWGMFVCAIFLLGRNWRLFYAVFETPATFFSGSRFPLRLLPSGLAAVGIIYPLAQATLLFRQVLSGTQSAAPIAMTMVGVSLAYVGIAYLTAQRAERLALQKGNLTFS